MTSSVYYYILEITEDIDSNLRSLEPDLCII